jgi:hypothetical protein
MQFAHNKSETCNGKFNQGKTQWLESHNYSVSTSGNTGCIGVWVRGENIEMTLTHLIRQTSHHGLDHCRCTLVG